MRFAVIGVLIWFLNGDDNSVFPYGRQGRCLDRVIEDIAEGCNTKFTQVFEMENSDFVRAFCC